MPEDVYGTRPDLLPDFLQSAGDESRQAVILNYTESQRLETESSNRFPAANSVELDWSTDSYQDRRRH
ncbi:hypothetical protein SAXI111661_10935 [Saccharomonospora xinjiangensis]|nr:hypothetical protein EYD13_11565 [Saccharomonospora xinjiangensis]